MQLYPLIIAAVLIVSGVLWQRSTVQTTQKSEDVQAVVPTAAIPTTEPTTSPTNSPEPTPTKKPVSPTTKSTNTPIPKNSGDTTIEFYYPNAQKVSGGNNQYTTSDSPDTVAAWYKEQFAKKQFSTKTSINTKVNGEQKILLSVAKQSEHISVTITRNNGENVTHITLEL
jgi:hypothetical protein